MYLLLELLHLDPNDLSWLAGGADNGRDRKWIHITCEFDAAAHRNRGGHCLAERRYAFAERNSCC